MRKKDKKKRKQNGTERYKLAASSDYSDCISLNKRLLYVQASKTNLSM